MRIEPAVIERLLNAAWQAREFARTYGPTRVGCVALADDETEWSGCNVEHRYRSHDLHAEVNALGNLVAGTSSSLVAVAIAAERAQFSPCGACMDWIFELGSSDCVIAWQASPGAGYEVHIAGELMPHYPR